MKGMILVGGRGTRLYPMTKVMPKGLLPVYDRPMIDYTIENLVKCGITDIIIVTCPLYEDIFKKYFENNEAFEANISLISQRKIKGTAIALQDAAPYIDGQDVVLLYADNILIGKNLKNALDEGLNNLKNDNCSVFTYKVDDPKGFGIVEVNEKKVISFEEKPEVPKSNLAAIGMYVLPKDFIDKVKNVKKSERGEYEVAELISMYQLENRLMAVSLDDYQMKWYDAGTPDSLLDASNMVKKYKEENFEKDS